MMEDVRLREKAIEKRPSERRGRIRPHWNNDRHQGGYAVSGQETRTKDIASTAKN